MSDGLRLSMIGLRVGEAARFRRSGHSRWHTGRISRCESDGSVTLHDSDGSARSLDPDLIEVQRPNRRGQLTWQTVSDLDRQPQQLDLFPESIA